MQYKIKTLDIWNPYSATAVLHLLETSKTENLGFNPTRVIECRNREVIRFSHFKAFFSGLSVDISICNYPEKELVR